VRAPVVTTASQPAGVCSSPVLVLRHAGYFVACRGRRAPWACIRCAGWVCAPLRDSELHRSARAYNAPAPSAGLTKANFSLKAFGPEALS
jgi:hypothetical protein